MDREVFLQLEADELLAGDVAGHLEAVDLVLGDEVDEEVVRRDAQGLERVGELLDGGVHLPAALLDGLGFLRATPKTATYSSALTFIRTSASTNVLVPLGGICCAFQGAGGSRSAVFRPTPGPAPPSA